MILAELLLILSCAAFIDVATPLYRDCEPVIARYTGSYRMRAKDPNDQVQKHNAGLPYIVLDSAPHHGSSSSNLKIQASTLLVYSKLRSEVKEIAH